MCDYGVRFFFIPFFCVPSRFVLETLVTRWTLFARYTHFDGKTFLRSVEKNFSLFLSLSPRNANKKNEKFEILSWKELLSMFCTSKWIRFSSWYKQTKVRLPNWRIYTRDISLTKIVYRIDSVSLFPSMRIELFLK